MAKLAKHRKVTYYIGMGMIILGFILFISVFFSFAGIMSNSHSMFSAFTGGFHFGRSIVGMLLMIAGSIVMNIGAKGAAGSGLLLDPEQAREDLKPFNEAKGGMINDVVSNIDVLDRFTQPNKGKEVIKIRCKSCGCLNDEDSKFCKSCGREI